MFSFFTLVLVLTTTYELKTSKSSELNLDHFYFSNLKFREPLECGMNVWLVWFRATVSMAESTLSGVVVHD